MTLGSGRRRHQTRRLAPPTSASRPFGWRRRDPPWDRRARDIAKRLLSHSARCRPRSPAPSADAPICRRSRGWRSCRVARPTLCPDCCGFPRCCQRCGVRRRIFKRRRGGCRLSRTRLCGARRRAPRAAAGARAQQGCGALAAGPAAESDAGAVAWALPLPKSTMTLRGSGALAGNAGNREVAGTGAGPDNNSGTINTISTTRIEAPTRRSLTRRSIELVSLKLKWPGAPQYIREARRAAESRAPRANQAPVPPCGRIQRRRFDPRAWHRPMPRRIRRLGCPRLRQAP